SVYMITDKKELLRSMTRILYSFVPVDYIDKTMDILSECNNIFTNFIVGKAIDSTIIGILCFILMNIFSMPYALLISVIVGITNMIPYFGPFIGAVPGVIILLIINPLTALGFVVL
ncbi:AI-2E family transporter, partial [Parabacteroides distasonis]